MEIGLDGKSNISERLNLKFDSYYHEKNVKSGFISERNRNTIGSWYTFFMTFNNPKVESEISIKYGKRRCSVLIVFNKEEIENYLEIFSKKKV